MGAFPQMQEAYARYEIATYPLAEDKVPAVTNFQRIGLKASRELARKFANAEAFGFVAGARNRLTIIDIDSPDEAILREAEERFGATPLQVITPSGGRHLYYRHGGESRRIRALPSVDVLGSGPIVGIGSRTGRGRYEIERGSLDDLTHLPPIVCPIGRGQGQPIHQGQRNSHLWQHCMRQARHCDDLNALLDCARTFNEDSIMPALSDVEVIKTAHSAWGYEQRGENRFGQPSASFPATEVFALWRYQDALLLLVQLRARNGPDAEFWIADGFSRVVGWDLKRFRAARAQLLALRYIALVQRPRRGQPGLYRWTGHRLVQADNGPPNLDGNPQHTPPP